MISFKRDGTVVRSDVTIFVPNYEARVFYFKWEAGSGAYAGFVSAQMQREMNAGLKAIRKDAYEQGWKDAKAKRTKEEWFSGTW